MIEVTNELVCNPAFDVESGYIVLIKFWQKKVFNLVLHDKHGHELIRDLEYRYSPKTGRIKFLRDFEKKEFPISASYIVLQDEFTGNKAAIKSLLATCALIEGTKGKVQIRGEEFELYGSI